MRNRYLTFIVAIVLLSGCKTNSKLPEIGDITIKGQGNWSKDYRNKVIKDCIDKASKKLSVSDAFSYCDCMAKKVEAKYPDENEVELSKEDIDSMKTGCLPSNPAQGNQPGQSNDQDDTKGWSDADKSEFMDNCIPTANRSLGPNGANDYCDCLLKKLMQEYPDSKNVDKATKAHLSILAAGCLGK